MVQAGGPAAINGFLFQILSHLAWVAEIRLDGRVAGHRFADDAVVVLEPRDGGDAQASDAGTYVVEQYKVRPDGTWSVKAVINQVLPDLRKAVREPAGQTSSQYGFVTDGRKGRFEAFETFLRSLRACAAPTGLDNAQQIKFGEGLHLTHYGLFLHIVQATRSPGDRLRVDEEGTVFDLLRNLRMAFSVTANNQATAVDRLLRQYAPDLGDEKAIRERLVGILMARLAKGAMQIDAQGLDDLLTEAGLSAQRLRNLARLSETMAYLAAEEATRMRYRPDMDVRKPPNWPASKPILVLAGTSGNGKTWQLARLARSLGERRELVALVRPAADAQDTLDRAAQVVWQEGLGETNEKTLVALTSHYKTMKPGATMPWLTVAVDDVQDMALARELVRLPWERWGMQLAMTVPEHMVNGLAQESPDQVHASTVGQFSVDEADALLKLHNKSWVELPVDLQKLVRIPILAGLYTALAHESFQSAPHSEYEIFERHWKRMRDRTPSGDPGIVLALAARVVDGKTYPLARAQWAETGLTDDAFARLAAVGWAQSNAASEVSIAHDRLLNWAIAQELARRHGAGEMSAEQLCAALHACVDPSADRPGRRLDYVPMDLLWLLTADTTNAGQLVALLELLELGNRFGSYGRGQELYENLLPTLGRRAVPLLMARLNALASQEGQEGQKGKDYRVGSIAIAMSKISKQEGVDLSDEAAELIGSDSAHKQQVGIALLTAAPVARLLDRLWELHLQRCERLDDQSSRWDINDYQSSGAALRAGTRLCPQWLAGEIEASTSSTGRVSELAYLLNSLDHPLAQDIWNKGKERLFDNIPANRPRALLHCLRRFSDRSRMDFVLRHLSQQEDFANGAALACLVKLDPDLAIQCLPVAPESHISFFRGGWLPGLLHARPAQTRQRLLDIAKGRSERREGRRFIEELFSDRPNELDIPTLRFVLHTFKADLQDGLEIACKSDPIWMTFPLGLFNGIALPPLLEVLRSESAGDLEAMVTQVACSRVGRTGRSHDHILEDARQFLIRLDGHGITQLVKAELQSTDFWGRHRGLNWAMVRPDQDTVALFAHIASQVVPFEPNGQPQSQPMREHYEATTALAAVKADSPLIDAIWQSNASYVNEDLAKLRGSDQAMDKELTRRALQILTATEPTEESDVIRALTTAWLSADSDFIVPVREVLARAGPATRSAIYACAALQQLGDQSEEFAMAASQMLASPENIVFGVRALSSLGEKGVPHLVQYLGQLPIAPWQDYEVRILRYVATHTGSRGFAVETAKRLCLSGRFLGDPPLDLAAESASPEIHELALTAAFAPIGVWSHRTLLAIKALAKYDTGRAIQAASRHLAESDAIERPLCQWLVESAAGAAAGTLYEIAATTQRPSLRPCVGRVLRRLDPTQIDALILEGLASVRREERALAVDLAGWLPPARLEDALRAQAAIETEDKTLTAFYAAFKRRESENIVMALFSEFRAAPENQRWGLLLSILHTGDPFLLSEEQDSMWLGHILDDQPYIYVRYANRELKDLRDKQQKKEARDASS